MSMSKFFGMIAISFALCAGCSETKSEETAALNQKGGVWMPNGPDQVSAKFNGDLFQGIRLVRERPYFVVDKAGGNAWNITDVSYRGEPVYDMPMTQGWFRFAYGNGKWAERHEAVDLTFAFNGPDPSGAGTTPFRMRVAGVKDSGVAKEYGLHWIYYSFLSSAGWSEDRSICVDAYGNDEPLVPVRNAFWNITTGDRVLDNNMISLACASAAVAGCMEYGYNPWQSHTECLDPTKPWTCHPANMWDIHQVCTRVKRADYCGTGKSHTKPGSLIQVFDWLSPPINNSGPDYFKHLEAIWGMNGVSCVNVGNLRHEELLVDDPTCYDQLYHGTPACNPERLGQNILGDLVLDEKM